MHTHRFACACKTDPAPGSEPSSQPAGGKAGKAFFLTAKQKRQKREADEAEEAQRASEEAAERQKQVDRAARERLLQESQQSTQVCQIESPAQLVPEWRPTRLLLVQERAAMFGVGKLHPFLQPKAAPAAAPVPLAPAGSPQPLPPPLPPIHVTQVFLL